MIRPEGQCTVYLPHNVPRTIFLSRLTIFAIVSPLEKVFQISKRDAFSNLNYSGGKNSLFQRQRRTVEINTAATSSQPWNLGNVSLPLLVSVSTTKMKD